MLCRQAIMRRIVISDFEAYVHATPEDGHCMLHAVANAILESYRTGIRNGKPISKIDIVKRLRQELLQMLGTINPVSGKTNYETIGNGAFAQSAKWNETTTPKYLKRVLSGSEQLGEEVKLILEFFIEKNILILDARSNQLYAKYSFKKNWPCIILYHTILGQNEDGGEIGHFEMVSLRETNQGGKQRTLFPATHPFVEYLLR